MVRVRRPGVKEPWGTARTQPGRGPQTLSLHGQPPDTLSPHDESLLHEEDPVRHTPPTVRPPTLQSHATAATAVLQTKDHLPLAPPAHHPIGTPG